jgi:hypothetical protein
MDRAERARLIEMYAAGYDEVMAALDGITEREWDIAEAPGEWSPRQVVHHLGESEMNSALRIRTLIAEEHATIMGYDQDRWATNLHYDRPVGPSLDAFRAARAVTAPLLLLMSDADWQRSGTHTGYGPMTAETWLEWYGAGSFES